MSNRSPELTEASAPVARSRPTSGWWRYHWPAVLVLAVGLLTTASLTVSSAFGYSSNEKKLTSLQTKLTGSVLETAQPQLNAVLGRVVGLAAEADDPVATFRSAMATELTPRGMFTSAALVEVEGGQVRELDHVGAAAINGVNSKAFDDLYIQAAQSPSLRTTRVVAGGVQRLGYLLSARGPNAVFVVGASQQLPASRRITVPAGSPDAGLNFALYFGPKATAAALVETNVGHLPLTGTTSTATVPFGNNVLTFVASPRGSLVGAWSQYLPWGILGAGVLLSFGAAAATDRLIRRRMTAESLASANAELYRQQRSVSEILQRSLLPKSLPAVPGFEFAYRYVPATQGAEIGGDWYTVVQVDDHRFAVVVGDVSGHGIAAAGTMASFRYTIRALAGLGFSPDEVLLRTMREMDLGDDDLFATALVGMVDTELQDVTFASAGHLPPLMITDGSAEFVNVSPGVPLGVADQRPDLATVGFTPGSTLVAYTDGLVERRGERLDFGLERLSAAAAQGPDDPEQLITHLLSTLRSSGQEDDIAVLAIRFSGRDAEPPAVAVSHGPNGAVDAES